MSSGRALIVDDQIELAENLAEVLQGCGFETEVASSAEAALVRIQQGDITVLVTDYKLPGQNGVELIEAIRREGRRIPALMMSAYTDDRTIGESQAAGAWSFLPKPVPLGALMEAFRSIASQPVAALLIDDEISFTDNLAEILTAAGHEVIVSGTAAGALGHHRRIETAVVDCRLPDGNGIDVARQLRARDPAIRILFISGYAEELRDHLSNDVAGAETMEKPLDTNDVVSWIDLAIKTTCR